MEQASKFVASLGVLFGAVAWPLVIGFVALKILPSLKIFLEKTNEISLKAGGLEATAKVQVAAALAAASTKLSNSNGQGEQSESISEKVAQTVNSLTDSNFEFERSCILWVDDFPDNTVYERQALSLMGVKFTLSDSTDDALEKIRLEKFDIIISDMQRPNDLKAGYTLLDKLPPNHAPYIIYRSSYSFEDVTEAQERGAFGITNKPEELFKMVLNVLGKMNEPSWRSAISFKNKRAGSLISPRR